MAQINMLPQRSRILPNIVENIYQNTNAVVQNLFNCYWMAAEFITPFAPLALINAFLDHEQIRFILMDVMDTFDYGVR